MPVHPTPRPTPTAIRWPALRVGVPRRGLWQETQPDIAAVLRRALAELGAAGVHVAEVDAPELQEAGERYMAGGLLIPPERTESLERHLPGWTDILDPTVGRRLERAHEVSAVEYIGLLRIRRRLSASLHARLEAQQIDLLATPTLPVTPPTLASLDDLDVYRAVNRAILSGTGPVSMLGHVRGQPSRGAGRACHARGLATHRPCRNRSRPPGAGRGGRIGAGDERAAAGYGASGGRLAVRG